MLRLALILLLASCHPQVKRTEPEPLDDERWCCLVSIRYGNGMIPVLGCTETREGCEWGRRRALARGSWIGIRNVGECKRWQ